MRSYVPAVEGDEVAGCFCVGVEEGEYSCFIL